MQKKCDNLTPINVDLKCYRNGSMVNCNADLLVGTRVRPICKPFHTYKDLVPIYQEIICQDDGTWDYKLFSCIYGKKEIPILSLFRHFLLRIFFQTFFKDYFSSSYFQFNSTFDTCFQNVVALLPYSIRPQSAMRRLQKFAELSLHGTWVSTIKIKF